MVRKMVTEGMIQMEKDVIKMIGDVIQMDMDVICRVRI
jgi:hypothetical protein